MFFLIPDIKILMSRADILTQSVKAIFAKRRKRLLEEDGGLAQGFTPSTVSFAVRENNALATIRQSSLSQAEVLDRAGYVPAQDDKVFVGAFYRGRPGARGWDFSSDSSHQNDSDSDDSEPSML